MILRKKNSYIKNNPLIISGIVLALSAIIPLSTVMAKGNDAKKYDINLNKNSQKVVVIETKIPVITPGESQVVREAREKAEAEAQAKAKASSAVDRSVVSRERRVYSDPANFDSIYMNAQSVFGVDWRLLKAVHYVETGCSGSTYKANPSGATGPMQFLPSTFRHYAVDGNGDGATDISNVEDAIFSAANYLRACGYPNVKSALYGYNPSGAYYSKVLNVASSLGFGS